MKATVKTGFDGRPDDEPVSRRVEAGEVITGELAAYAVARKLAEVAAEQKAPTPGKPGAKRRGKGG